MSPPEVFSYAPLLDRGRELQELVAGIEDARSGGGSLWFLTGEPGIGKSRLCEELARHAAERGLAVHWGRCWEAGGAPAFWPFIQVLRSSLDDGELEHALSAVPPARGRLLAQLLPELQARFSEAPAAAALALASEQARFQMLDAITGVLCELARRTPQLLILEDLHAADTSSILLLDFLAATARKVALTVVGTFREGKLPQAEGGALLARTAAKARTLPLRRLPRRDVAAFLAAQLQREPREELVSAVMATTEGNPLFVVETARLLIAHGHADPAIDPAAGVPASIKSVIEERLAQLSQDCRAVLELGSVLGRDLDRYTLAALAQREAAELAVPLSHAVDAAILLEVSPGHYRFTHILIREVLYQGIAEAQRRALHLQAAHALQAQRDRPATEVAHHYLCAGPEAAEQAAAAATRAAERAMQQLAFGDAASLYRLALQALGQQDADAARSIRLQLCLARAQILAGEGAAGRESCFAASAQARAAGLPELLAEAALELGRVFVIAKVDAALVSLLREALDALGPSDRPVRARVMARLAAAEQPARDPRGPIELAKRAIALARRVGEPADLLETLRAGCSAMMDLAPPAEREPLNREHEALAQRLRDPAEALRGAMRLTFDLFEQGRVSEAHAAIERCTQYAAQLDHPHYRWRVVALSAMRAVFEGRFSDATAAREEAAALGRLAGDPNAETVRIVQQLAQARLCGADQEVQALAPALQALSSGQGLASELHDLVTTSELLRAGQATVAAGPWTARAIETALSVGDRTLLEYLADVAAARDDQELARRVLERFGDSEDHFIHGGMMCMTWDGPVSHALARFHEVLDQYDEARRLFEHALRGCREAGTPLHEVWGRRGYAGFLARRGETRAAAEQLQAALSGAHALAAPGLARKIEQSLAQLDHRARRATPRLGEAPLGSLSMVQEGSLWWVDAGSARFALRDTKGVRMLARLLAEPGRELHALELTSPGGAPDSGDAGALLDDEARDQYRARAAELREALEQAETDNDLARAEHARRELSFLEAELARALGLGGRQRRAGSAAERARVNVQRRLKDAIQRVAEHDAELARHLTRSIRTGTFCVYEP